MNMMKMGPATGSIFASDVMPDDAAVSGGFTALFVAYGAARAASIAAPADDLALTAWGDAVDHVIAAEVETWAALAAMLRVMIVEGRAADTATLAAMRGDARRCAAMSSASPFRKCERWRGRPPRSCCRAFEHGMPLAPDSSRSSIK